MDTEKWKMENGKWKMKTTGGPIGSVDHCGIAEKRRKKAKKELCSREGAKTQRKRKVGGWQFSVGRQPTTDY